MGASPAISHLLFYTHVSGAVERSSLGIAKVWILFSFSDIPRADTVIPVKMKKRNTH
jgi:hypothetical protein